MTPSTMLTRPRGNGGGRSRMCGEFKMLPLPDVPKTFRDLVEADLRRAARLIIKIQDEIDWQFRIATPEGDYHLSITMPDAEDERSAMLGRLTVFMMWKRAVAYVLAVETREPDAVYAVGVSASEQLNCLVRITRTPRPWTAANFSAVEWLGTESIAPELIELLPRIPQPMTPKQIRELQEWFGADGKFPAAHIDSREIRGV